MTDLVTSATAFTGASRARPDPDAAAGPEVSSDFETFLRMLTVQLQNQDPLNPVDSTDYATQLATFSSVEQQVKTNDLLTEIGAQLGIGGLTQAGGWIGMDALVRAPAFFDGRPVTIRPELPAGADRGVLVVRDSTGAVIDRASFGPEIDSIEWVGNDDTGTPFPPGIYRFEIESYADDELLTSQLGQVYSRIEEVRSDAGAILVRLSDGTEVPSTMIGALRAPLI